MRLNGGAIEHIVLDFIQAASPSSRRTVGSAAWRVNRDNLYDALLELDPDDDKMRGVLLYSLLRAGNRRAYAELMNCLRSRSRYLHDVSAVFAVQVIDRFRLKDTEINELLVHLQGILHGCSEVARFAIVSAMIRCSKQEYVPNAEGLLRESLLRES